MKFLQIALGIEFRNRPLRIPVVDDSHLETVAQEDHRSAPVFFLHNIRIESGLNSAVFHVGAGALRFHNCQRPAVIPVQHVIRKTFAGGVRHSFQPHLLQPVLAFRPTGSGQHNVDVYFSRIEFRQIQRLWNIIFHPLFSSRTEFVFQCPVLFDELLDVQFVLLRFLLGEGFLLLQLILCAEKLPMEIRRIVGSGIAARHKIHKVEQVLYSQRRLFIGNLHAGMRRIVSQRPHILNPPHQIIRHQFPEAIGIDHRNKGFFIWHPKKMVRRVHPFDGEFHRLSAPDCARFRIDSQQSFRPNSHIRKRLKLCILFEEIKVTHCFSPIIILTAAPSPWAHSKVILLYRISYIPANC